MERVPRIQVDSSKDEVMAVFEQRLVAESLSMINYPPLVDTLSLASACKPIADR